MDLRDAQSGQRQFDADHWEVNGNDFVKLRHITLHLATLLGKIGARASALPVRAQRSARPDPLESDAAVQRVWRDCSVPLDAVRKRAIEGHRFLRTEGPRL